MPAAPTKSLQSFEHSSSWATLQLDLVPHQRCSSSPLLSTKPKSNAAQGHKGSEGVSAPCPVSQQEVCNPVCMLGIRLSDREKATNAAANHHLGNGRCRGSRWHASRTWTCSVSPCLGPVGTAASFLTPGRHAQSTESVIAKCLSAHLPCVIPNRQVALQESPQQGWLGDWATEHTEAQHPTVTESSSVLSLMALHSCNKEEGVGALSHEKVTHRKKY